MSRAAIHSPIRRATIAAAALVAGATLVMAGFAAPAQADNGSNANLILSKLNTYRAKQSSPALSPLITNEIVDQVTQRFANDYYADYADCLDPVATSCTAKAYNFPGGYNSFDDGAIRLKTGPSLTTRAANALIAYDAGGLDLAKWPGNYGSVGYVVHGSYAYITFAVLRYPAGTEPAVPSPVYNGHLNVGQVLTAGTGWKPVPTTVTYQWLRDDQAIPDATGVTYEIAATDAGHRIDLQQTASGNGNAGFVIRSHTTATVAKPLIDIPEVPHIAEVDGGSLPPFYGDKLEVIRGGAPWQPLPTTIKYQWYKGGAAISGATKSTYTPGAAEIGYKLKVKLTASKSGYTTTSTVTVPGPEHTDTSTIVLPLPYTQVPSEIDVSGVYTVGRLLTAHAGTWAPKPTSFTYEWMRDGVPIAGATHSTHTLTSADLGHSVNVEVDAHKTHYQPAGVDSVAQLVSAP
jgi:hypothetical protein